MYVTQDISLNIGDMFTNLGFLFNQQKYMSKNLGGDHSLHVRRFQLSHASSWREKSKRERTKLMAF